jgi:hypothetical protein
VDLLLLGTLHLDETVAVRLQIEGVDFELLGRDLQHHLARLARGHDDGVADAMGPAAGEGSHAVWTGIGVGSVDQNHLQRKPQRLRRALGDDGFQTLPEIDRRERNDETAGRGGVNQRLRGIATQIHPGRIVDGGKTAPAQPGHHYPSRLVDDIAR